MKRLAVLLALVLLGSGCAAFSDDTGAASDSGNGGSTLVVATSFYPLQYVTQRIAGDLADVENLTRPGQEPHDLELSVQQTAEIAQADLVVFERDLQPGVAEAIDQNADGETLEVSDVVTLEETSHDGHDHGSDDASGEHEEGEEGEEGEDGHDHGGLDPHFWQDPLLLAQVADAVAGKLSDIDPDHAETYATNAAALDDDLTTLDDDYSTALASCERTAVVVSHDAFGYLGRYGLDFYPIAGLSPDAEPTPADLGRLQELITTEGITTVFGETLVSPRVSETLADDMGVSAKVLDPIEGLTDETADQDYLSIMQDNLAALKEANGCQ